MIVKVIEVVPDEFYALFAVDSRHVPVGTVPLYVAMRKGREEKISDIVTTNPKIIRVGDKGKILHLF